MKAETEGNEMKRELKTKKWVCKRMLAFVLLLVSIESRAYFINEGGGSESPHYRRRTHEQNFYHNVRLPTFTPILSVNSRPVPLLLIDNLNLPDICTPSYQSVIAQNDNYQQVELMALSLIPLDDLLNRNQTRQNTGRRQVNDVLLSEYIDVFNLWILPENPIYVKVRGFAQTVFAQEQNLKTRAELGSLYAKEFKLALDQTNKSLKRIEPIINFHQTAFQYYREKLNNRVPLDERNLVFLNRDEASRFERAEVGFQEAVCYQKRLSWLKEHLESLKKQMKR